MVIRVELKGDNYNDGYDTVAVGSRPPTDTMEINEPVVAITSFITNSQGMFKFYMSILQHFGPPTAETRSPEDSFIVELMNFFSCKTLKLTVSPRILTKGSQTMLARSKLKTGLKISQMLISKTQGIIRRIVRNRILKIGKH